MDNKKGNLKQKLLQVNKDILENSTEDNDKRLSLMGRDVLTHPGYNNSMRTTMFNSHTAQFLTLSNPDFPKTFFGAENVVGENSDSYYKTKSNVEVYRKVVKFEKLFNELGTNPVVYQLFTYDRDNDTYSVVNRYPVEDLSEMFGYEYDCTEMDKYNEGDIINKDTVLYKTKSYDENCNYRYGKNANIMYTLSPITYEDAAGIREGFIKEFGNVEVFTYRVSINNNDFLLNMFGDKNNYKTLADIGSKVDGVVLASRRKFNKQLLFDFRTDNLSKILEGDEVYHGSGVILDYTIYYNNTEIEENTFNKDLLKYYNYQNKYWEKIRKTCKEIIESGSKYTKDIDYLYKQAKDMLNTESKWKEGDTSFNNIVLDIVIMNEVSVELGQKFTPRYGNKTVVGKIIPDEQMPYYYDEDGNKVHADMYFNLLAIINRTTAYPLIELCNNWMATKCERYLRTLDKLKEKEKVLFTFLKDFDEDYGKESEEIYKSLSKKEKEAYMEEITHGNGILLRDLPFQEKIPIFYRLLNIYKKYDWLNDDIVYKYKWGREIPILNRYRISKMYVLKLKQTSKKGFSARNMGAVNSKGLPERSYKSKAHLDKYSSTAIRFGEYETIVFSIGQESDEIAIFNALYRTSVKGRKDLAKMLLNPDNMESILDDTYISRTSEIFNVLLKSLGYGIEFFEEDNELSYHNANNINEYIVDDKALMVSDFDGFMINRIDEISSKILSEHNEVIDKNELIDTVRDVLTSQSYLIGTKDPDEIERLINLYFN
jgi:RNA polymerase rpb2, domain 6|uniref:DNA-directed RNA polymerase n=1 Tax=Myoviridae sp. ctXXl13 TaxID=2827691 RepID=A0A8S5TIU1_9CAUD|nr:MAG TPA: bifunctional DNA-directed RNA polymerase subunit beta/beta' [Myoviridae sp. ctXXl13]